MADTSNVAAEARGRYPLTVHVSLLREDALGEKRVALTPAAIAKLTRGGHAVTVEANAGRAAGFVDA